MFGLPKLSRGTSFTIQTICGVVVGVGLGFGLREAHYPWTKREVMYLKFVGDLFLRALGAMILPLIVSSLIDAVGSLDLSLSKKIGTRALVFYLSTTAFAAILGIVLGVIIKPGAHSDMDVGDECKASESSTTDTLLDLVRNIFPSNLVGATIQVTKTVVNSTNDTIPFNDRDVYLQMIEGTNMLGLVIFAIVLGLTLGNMGESGKPVLNFFKSLGDASMLITSNLVITSPVAICFLIAGSLVAQDDIAAVFQNIAWYFATVMAGLIIHGLVVLPLLFFAFTRTLPIKFFASMTEALVTAFGTASSSATLPVTLRCLEEKLGMDTRVSRFVIPIGATVNMNGTALYLPVGAIYIAQLCGQSLSIGQFVVISLVAIATSIGTAGIPQVGMVILIAVLNSVGLPVDYIGLIVPLDWLLERFRTAVNVLGDAIGAEIVAQISKDDLMKISMNAEGLPRYSNAEEPSETAELSPIEADLEKGPD